MYGEMGFVTKKEKIQGKLKDSGTNSLTSFVLSNTVTNQAGPLRMMWKLQLGLWLRGLFRNFD
jgi:hypothetical protein